MKLYGRSSRSELIDMKIFRTGTPYRPRGYCAVHLPGMIEINDESFVLVVRY